MLTGGAQVRLMSRSTASSPHFVFEGLPGASCVNPRYALPAHHRWFWPVVPLINVSWLSSCSAHLWFELCWAAETSCYVSGPTGLGYPGRRVCRTGSMPPQFIGSVGIAQDASGHTRCIRTWPSCHHTTSAYLHISSHIRFCDMAFPVRDWWLELHNYCQNSRLQLSKQETQRGPQNNPTWIVSLFVNGVEYGRGESLQKGAARQLAAEMALRVLCPNV
ncbi:hypothetical protein FKP32DRAFT_411387 [Trametes sanguinea]|nr:hypothetical protein FKP32DRAFT_411387 [Trametes sanguinea]